MKSKTKYYVEQTKIIEIFKKANLGEVTNVSALEEGEFNSAYFVTANEKDYVIKIAPVSKNHLLTYEHDLMQREVAFYKLIAQNTSVKTPKIYYFDDSKSLIPSNYFIMEKLTSKPLTDCHLTIEERKEVYAKVGLAISELHNIKGKKFGYEQNKLFDNWYLALKNMVENLCEDCKRYNKPYKYGTQLLCYIEKYKDILIKVEPSYTHFDIWDGNVFYDKDNGEIAIIDTERGFWGDSIADFVNVEMFTSFKDKVSVVAYNKTAKSQISFSNEEIIRFNLMKAYLGLIVYTEKFARYKLWQSKYFVNVSLAKLFFSQAYKQLNER